MDVFSGFDGISVAPRGCVDGEFDVLVVLEEGFGEGFEDGFPRPPVSLSIETHLPAAPGPDLATWHNAIGLLCEMIGVARRRGQKVLLIGISAATLAAAFVLKNSAMSLAEVSKMCESIEGYSQESLREFEMTIPGKRLVMAPSVQPPVMVAPRLPAQPTGTAEAMAQSLMMGQGVPSQGVPPPQSGMLFAPVVGAQPGQLQSRPGSEQDRDVDAALSLLPGHRPALQGQPGQRPQPPEGAELVSVPLGAIQQEAAHVVRVEDRIGTEEKVAGGDT